MMRILVVDGEPVATGALCSLLSMDGYSAVGLCGTDEAIQRLRREPFDAVITDVELPGGHGLEVVRVARELRPDAPVLVVTGLVNSLASNAARSMGVRSVLGKPLSYETLISELRMCIHDR
ncbi:response regulator [Archangium lansingense]|uniref:Response regulator n=1 Tax=Archangium lansingense TaxID=2995310 RepID=A0ABT4AFQ2_9BACT|nr:response regulator [Archangium lansinium]MCY1080517.1 response regulator [Archangium lansinium]